ncbi:MAG TPA: thiopurine S-methyltransferase [Gammaproteobacteria bacterium]|nr:thiopurine S-methyltransferase [Gammaproteobacteria bacterium]
MNVEPEYWITRWQEGRTGWHHGEVMPLLAKHWGALEVPPGTRVLVPFCGKSLDMLWLAEQGLKVLGVEVAPLAIEQFFADNHLAATKREAADGIHYTAGDIEIIQGNLFETDAATLAGCGAVYDRAAIIAQSPSQRRRYAESIYGALPADCRGLMITLEYPQAEMAGPPFSVDADEVNQLFGAHWDIDIAERRDILANQPGFQKDGVTALHTAIYRLHRRAD